MNTRMHRKPPDSRRRGYIMVEMMVTLGLIIVLSGIAGRLMVNALMLMRETTDADRVSAAVDHAVQRVRRDVEGATNVAAMPNGVSLGEVSWRVDGDALVRTVDGQDARFEPLPEAKLATADGRVTLGIGRAMWTLRPIVEGAGR